MNKSIFFLLGILIFLVQGCATLIPESTSEPYLVKPDRNTTFQERPDKLPLKVGLYLSDAARTYPIICSGKSGLTPINLTFIAGETLEANAVESLKKSFSRVTVIKEKSNLSSDIERIISINFSPQSKIDRGSSFAVSPDRTVTVILDTTVYDNHWSEMWKIETKGTTVKGCGQCDSFPLIPFPSVSI